MASTPLVEKGECLFVLYAAIHELVILSNAFAAPRSVWQHQVQVGLQPDVLTSMKVALTCVVVALKVYGSAFISCLTDRSSLTIVAVVYGDMLCITTLAEDVLACVWVDKAETRD